MNVKVPALAPDCPPETGQSRYVIPELSKNLLDLIHRINADGRGVDHGFA